VHRQRKGRAPYEFGVKVSIVTTNACAPGGQFVLQAKALPANPYDGHTLRDALEDTQRLTGREIERAYVDKGYRGHDAPKPRSVFISGQKRGVFLGHCYLKCRRCRQRNAHRRRIQLQAHPRLAQHPFAPNPISPDGHLGRRENPPAGFLTSDQEADRVAALRPAGIAPYPHEGKEAKR
jgi:hypothetical protein